MARESLNVNASTAKALKQIGELKGYKGYNNIICYLVKHWEETNEKL